MIDGAGVYGNVLHWALVIFFVGSAFLIFLFLWCKGRLDMDEGPKMQMMFNDENEGEQHE